MRTWHCINLRLSCHSRLCTWRGHCVGTSSPSAGNDIAFYFTLKNCSSIYYQYLYLYIYIYIYIYINIYTLYLVVIILYNWGSEHGSVNRIRYNINDIRIWRIGTWAPWCVRRVGWQACSRIIYANVLLTLDTSSLGQVANSYWCEPDPRRSPISTALSQCPS